MAKVKLIYDVTPEEKEWLEDVVLATEPGQTKIGLLRLLLDRYADEKGLPNRPGRKEGK